MNDAKLLAPSPPPSPPPTAKIFLPHDHTTLLPNKSNRWPFRIAHAVETTSPETQGHLVGWKGFSWAKVYICTSSCTACSKRKYLPLHWLPLVSEDVETSVRRLINMKYQDQFKHQVKRRNFLLVFSAQILHLPGRRSD